MRTLPINLSVEGRRCLVVGGGTIALQKVQVLSASGIETRVVAPFIMREIEAAPGVSVCRRKFQPSDLDGVFFAIAATDDAELNHEVYRLGHERGMLVNCVDDPAWCDFIMPSILRRGELTVSVSTGGHSPALARMLRQWLETELRDDFDDVLDLAGEMRRQARRRIGCPGARRAASECVARMALKARATDVADLAARMKEVVRLVEGPAPITVTIDPEHATPGKEHQHAG